MASRSAELALEIYRDVLDEVAADKLVRGALRRVGDILFVQDRPIDLGHYEHVYVCGAGKASGWMALPATELLGDRLGGGVVITSPEGRVAVPGTKVLLGSHPLPDESSIAAGEGMLRFAESTTPRDLVLFCLSGGASALMEAPREGITLADLRETTERLMRFGVDIRTLNSVRQRLSRIKGGGLGAAFPAEVIVLVLSDIIGDDGTSVGSAPFATPKKEDGRAAAAAHRVELPEAVSNALLELQFVPPRRIPHHVVGSAALLWPLAQAAARKRGLEPVGYADAIIGEARDEGRRIAQLALTKQARGETGFCMVFAGEATVTVTGNGLGGRCQEMAVAALGELEGKAGLAFLAAGTDGRDGPTNAAGGVIDGATNSSAISIENALTNNDAYHFLESANALVVAPQAKSNVNDIILVVAT
jgi:glycerate-2-kinase